METTIEDLMALAVRTRSDITLAATGSILLDCAPVSLHQIKELAASVPANEAPPTPLQFSAPGYHSLATVLLRAFEQAARGKGAERHAQGAPFDQQPMQELCSLYGVGFALGQAAKKAQESQRLPHARAVAELLGAINYLAGAVVFMEGQADQPVARPANDNAPCCSGGTQTLARCTGCLEANGLQAEAKTKK